MVASSAPDQFIDQFLGPRATVFQTLETSADLLIYGLGAWALFACLAPAWRSWRCRGSGACATAAGPSGSWRPTEWHHVRYTVLPVAMILAAGVIGYARLGAWLKARRGGWFLLVRSGSWPRSLAAGIAGAVGPDGRGSPCRSAAQEAEAIWYWIRQVGPDDGVLAAYEVTAPLSSRKRLFSYVLEQNKPRGFPQLGPEFQWVFLRNKAWILIVFLDQGFDVVHQGDFLTVLHRASQSGKEP